jgi:hypothetical protein
MSANRAGRTVRRLVSLSVVGLLAWSAAGSSLADVVLTEIDPSGSSNSDPNSGYGTDWFELTNTGATSVSISGWTMVDSHYKGTSTTGAALNVVNSSSGAPTTDTVAPGQSVIFFESSSTTLTTSVITNFEAAWWGTNPNAVPKNLVFGTYDDNGSYGLSGSGDAVNIFNGAPSSTTLVQGVTFGAPGTVNSGKTFETFGVSGTTAIPSVAGVNGAFDAASGMEVGSPGIAPVPLPPAAWLLLSGAALFLIVGVRNREFAVR